MTLCYDASEECDYLDCHGYRVCHREECHIRYFYTFNQLPVGRDQNEKASLKLGLFPYNRKVRLFKKYELKLRLFMSINPSINYGY